jgi:hypothetical protein
MYLCAYLRAKCQLQSKNEQKKGEKTSTYTNKGKQGNLYYLDNNKNKISTMTPIIMR